MRVKSKREFAVSVVDFPVKTSIAHSLRDDHVAIGATKQESLATPQAAWRLI
jgi:hypothetical protein